VKNSGLFFLSLATRLVNDDSPACREKIADALELLIKQLPNNSREQNFSIVLTLLKDMKMVHREMAAQLTIRFINACNSEFISPKLTNLLQLLLNSTSLCAEDEPGKFVRVKRAKLESDEDDDGAIDERDQQTIEDHHLIQTLNAIIKVMEYEGVMKNSENQHIINEIGFKAHALISHDHIWVRVLALKIIKLILKNLDVEKILTAFKDDQISADEFLYSKSQFQSMAFDMCVQIKPEIDQILLDAILEDLLGIARVIKDVPIAGSFNDKKDFNLLWLIRRLRYAVHAEIATTPSAITLRKPIFNFFNSLMEIIDKRMITKLASSMLTPMLREMVEGEHVIEDLKQVAMQVGNRIKQIIGLQDYDKIRLELQSKMLHKRVNRRKALAQEKINNPAKAATRNIRKQLKKQDNKKRKRKDIQEGIILPKKKRRIFGNAMNDTYE
jgi:U3 small nucleolar RNA-associated protein 20